MNIIILSLGLTLPKGLGVLIVSVFFGGLINFFVLPFILCYSQYYLLIFRNKIIGFGKNGGINLQINYDKIDEQLIDNINQFTSSVNN